MSNKEKIFLNMKTQRSNSDSEQKNNSNGSDDYIIANKSNSSYTIKHISRFETFKEIISQIKNPSYTTDTKFLSDSAFSEKVKNKDNFNKEINFTIPLENINKEKTFEPKKPLEFFQMNNKF